MTHITTHAQGYDELVSNIEERLELLEKSISIINRAKKENRSISLEEFRILDENVRSDTAIENNLLAIILEDQAIRAREKGYKYEPMVLSPSEFSAFVDTLVKNGGLVDGDKYDIILSSKENIGHCTPVQISCFDGVPQIIAPDASVDNSNRDQLTVAAKKLKVSDEELQFGLLGLQADATSCSIFSAKHLKSIFKLSKDGKYTFDLHPKFLKNSQNLTAMERLKKHVPNSESTHVSKEKTLTQYIQEYSASVETVSSGESITKKRNYSILFKKQKYLQRALDLLKKIPAGESRDRVVLEILQKRKGGEFIKDVSVDLSPKYKLPKSLNAKQLEEITYENEDCTKRRLENEFQIDLVLNHGVKAIKFSRSRIAFSNPEYSKLSYEFILKGETEVSRNILAGEVSKMQYKETFIALVKYGIKTGIIFGVSEDKSVKAFEFLEKIYELSPGSPEEKKKAALVFYKKINSAKTTDEIEEIFKEEVRILTPLPKPETKVKLSIKKNDEKTLAEKASPNPKIGSYTLPIIDFSKIDKKFASVVSYTGRKTKNISNKSR